MVEVRGKNKKTLLVKADGKSILMVGVMTLAMASYAGNAFATIDNTVTVLGTPPGGPVDSVTATASESVDVIDANPNLTIVKSATLSDGTPNNNAADVGETVIYTYTVTNSGNVTLTDVAVQDTHEGALLASPPANEVILTDGPNNSSDLGAANDGEVEVLDVGAVAVFTYTHTVTQQEVDDQ